MSFAPWTAMALISSFDLPKTTRRCAGEVELYMWMTTRFAPMSDWKVFSIKSSRACTSTWMVTSSGMRPFSMSSRLKANSVFDADGKPISISLKPHFTSA